MYLMNVVVCKLIKLKIVNEIIKEPDDYVNCILTLTITSITCCYFKLLTLKKSFNLKLFPPLNDRSKNQ